MKGEKETHTHTNLNMHQRLELLKNSCDEGDMYQTVGFLDYPKGSKYHCLVLQYMGPKVMSGTLFKAQVHNICIHAPLGYGNLTCVP